MASRRPNTKRPVKSLGKSLIRDKLNSASARRNKDSYLHTCEVSDGADLARLNLQSVTEESSLNEFLKTAQLAGTEFTAERLNIQVMNPSNPALPNSEQLKKIQDSQEKFLHLLKIPRRPAWDNTTTREELEENERKSFLNWRRQLAKIQEEEEDVVFTPFEKNLEVWRQLWRVVEKSDVIVQIVDARRPLLFRCEDLEQYVKEVCDDKVNALLVNKADLLTSTQRKVWRKYFERENIKAVFWSAALQAATTAADVTDLEEPQVSNSEADGSGKDDANDDPDVEEDDANDDPDIEDDDANDDPDIEGDDANDDPDIEGDANDDPDIEDDDANDDPDIEDDDANDDPDIEDDDANDDPDIEDDDASDDPDIEDDDASDDPDVEEDDTSDDPDIEDDDANDNPDVEDDDANDDLDVEEEEEEKILNRKELLSWLQCLSKDFNKRVINVGMVGYPNVGKSSTINALLEKKKVAVSATPGKTKHYQTHFVDEGDICLFDCPGLVMPSFVLTKAEMFLNGILPIDQLRDSFPPVALICRYIPTYIFEKTYGLSLPTSSSEEDEGVPPGPPPHLQLLMAFGYMKGFMTSKGMPDSSRSARIILKDFVKGKILYCHGPPGINQSKFHEFPPPTSSRRSNPNYSQKIKYTGAKTFDKQFFEQELSKIHIKNKAGTEKDGKGKPWKKHNNKHKKEKARRLYSHLDN